MSVKFLKENPGYYPLACNGCFEQGESGGRVHSGRYHKGLKMWVGAGCDECNHMGYDCYVDLSDKEIEDMVNPNI